MEKFAQHHIEKQSDLRNEKDLPVGPVALTLMAMVG